jgi:hypothetical protein
VRRLGVDELWFDETQRSLAFPWKRTGVDQQSLGACRYQMARASHAAGNAKERHFHDRILALTLGRESRLNLCANTELASSVGNALCDRVWAP